MEKKELVKGMTYLGIAVGKQYTSEECEIFYDFLKKYDYQVFINAVKNRIKKSSFPPKINELINECDLQNSELKLKTIETMNKNGYFKIALEYEKAINFVKRGIIPEWLQRDMTKYSNSTSKLMSKQKDKKYNRESEESSCPL